MTEIEVQYGINTCPMSQFIISANDAAYTYIPILHYGNVVLTDPDQLWFWTDEWQEGERRVDDYIEAGNIQEFDTMEDFLLSLQE